MTVYLINISLIFIWAFLLLLVKPSAHNKIAYCAIVCFQWVAISGLRDWSVGADTMAYYAAFERVKQTEWSTLFNNLYRYTFYGYQTKDPGYPLVEKIFQIFCGNYQAFLLFIAFLFTVSLAVWIYKNSTYPCLSFVIYSTLFYSFYAVTGHRQTIATALVVFIGYYFIKKRKLIPFLLLIFVAFFIHKSSICFLPFYFISYKKITWKYLLIFSSVSVAFLVLGPSFYGPFANFIGYDVEDYQYVANTSTYVILVCAVMLAAFILFKQIKANNPDRYMIIYNAMMIGTVFAIASLRNQNFMRIQQYYLLIMMLMIPEMVKAIDKKYRFVPYLAGSAFLTFKMIQSCSPYHFFWQ